MVLMILMTGSTLNQRKGWDSEPRSLLWRTIASPASVTLLACRHSKKPTWQSCKFTQLTKYNGEHQNTTRKRVFFCRTFQILIYFQFQALNSCTQPVLYSRTEKVFFRESFVQDGSGDCNHSVYLKAFTLHRLDFSRRDISQIVPSLFFPPQHT